MDSAKIYKIAYQYRYLLVFILCVGVIAITVQILHDRHMENLRSRQFIIVPMMMEGFANIKVGSNSYKVHEDLENPRLAAETMDRLNGTALNLIEFVKNKYVDGPGMKIVKPEYHSIVKSGIRSLRKNFKTANLEENIPERSGGDTSYVIDKGDVFAMCLRDPKNGNRIEDKYNNLVFVLVHEMTHLFTSTYGHDKLFWNNFRFLLAEAVEAGMYTPVDYKKTGSPYCGVVVSYSPLFDSSLKEYRLEF